MGIKMKNYKTFEQVRKDLFSINMTVQRMAKRKIQVQDLLNLMKDEIKTLNVNVGRAIKSVAKTPRDGSHKRGKTNFGISVPCITVHCSFRMSENYLAERTPRTFWTVKSFNEFLIKIQEI